ncbi:MAG: exosome protein [Methanosphaera sp. rholeuAM74]|nr:MAG: exosome protein [Methanosphaera sp. rholeuAM74]
MIHNISYRTFIYGTEDEDKVLQAIGFIFNSPLPEKTVSQDHFGNSIFILTEKITKKRTNRDIVKFIEDNLSDDDKSLIRDELDRRIDDKGNLFLRFDKQEAYNEELKLTYSGDAIHVRIKLASYPVSKDNAIQVAEKLFNFL